PAKEGQAGKPRFFLEVNAELVLEEPRLPGWKKVPGKAHPSSGQAKRPDVDTQHERSPGGEGVPCRCLVSFQAIRSSPNEVALLRVARRFFFGRVTKPVIECGSPDNPDPPENPERSAPADRFHHFGEEPGSYRAPKARTHPDAAL